MSYEEDYFTDLITNRSISFIRRTKQAKPDSPFLAVLSHSAPHGPETAAPQYSNAFPNARAPRYVVTSNTFTILFSQHQELVYLQESEGESPVVAQLLLLASPETINETGRMRLIKLEPEMSGSQRRAFGYHTYADNGNGIVIYMNLSVISVA